MYLNILYYHYALGAGGRGFESRYPDEKKELH